MKLQKQLSRKVAGKEYAKWVVVIPQKEIDKAGFKEGEELVIEAKGKKILLKSKISSL